MAGILCSIITFGATQLLHWYLDFCNLDLLWLAGACDKFALAATPREGAGLRHQAQEARPALQPPHAIQDWSPFVATIPGTAVTFEMRPLPAGQITIADSSLPEGKRLVAINPIWIGKTEVTWDEYDLYAFQLEGNAQTGALDAVSRPSKPYGAPDRGFGHKGYAALGVTFHAAQEYCRWLSAKSGRKYRLPTEAEWEYACRAGDLGQFAKEKLAQCAWHWDNAEDKTHPVATKASNAYGLHDMLGNAAEWVSSRNGTPLAAGGSFKSKAAQLDFGTRARQSPSWNMTDPQMPKSKWWLSDAAFVGFRVVCEP